MAEIAVSSSTMVELPCVSDMLLLAAEVAGHTPTTLFDFRPGAFSQVRLLCRARVASTMGAQS